MDWPFNNCTAINTFPVRYCSDLILCVCVCVCVPCPSSGYDLGSGHFHKKEKKKGDWLVVVDILCGAALELW